MHRVASAIAVSGEGRKEGRQMRFLARRKEKEERKEQDEVVLGGQGDGRGGAHGGGGEGAVAIPTGPPQTEGAEAAGFHASRGNEGERKEMEADQRKDGTRGRFAGRALWPNLVRNSAEESAATECQMVQGK